MVQYTSRIRQHLIVGFFLSLFLSLISIKIIQYNVFYITFYIKLPLVYINVFVDVFPCVICCCGNVHLEIGATIFSERERERKKLRKREFRVLIIHSLFSLYFSLSLFFSPPTPFFLSCCFCFFSIFRFRFFSSILVFIVVSLAC